MKIKVVDYHTQDVCDEHLQKIKDKKDREVIGVNHALGDDSLTCWYCKDAKATAQVTFKYKEKEEDIKFEIIEVVTERSPNGKSYIQAKCLKDDIFLKITVPNDSIVDRELIKRMLLDRYKEIKEASKPISIGEVL